MSGVVPMNMSESSYAIDSAWSLLQSDDRVEKFLPLIPLAVGGAFGALGAYTGAGGRFINPETGKFDPGMYAKPKYQDPLTGGLIAEREVGDTRFSTGNTTQDRFLGGAVGALQGLNPFAATGAVVRGTRGAVGLSRAQRAERAAERAKAAREASEAAAAKARRSTDRLRGSGNVTIAPQRQPSTAVTPQRRDELYSLAGDARRTSDKLGRRASKLDDIANQPTMYQNYGQYGRMAQLAGNVEEQLGPKFAALAGAAAMSQMPQAPTTGFGAQSQMGTAGAAPTQGTPVSGNRDPYALREIYNPKAGSDFERQKEFGGLGVQKGDNMFRENIGEELLKEAKERMDKAHCMTEQKADDKDGKKKPAHGMVIVIGSKAGPGPSTDGKRDKLDSEKKKE